MVDAGNLLNPILADIAKKEEYNNYGTNITLYHSKGANYTSRLYTVTLSAPAKNDLNLFVKVAVTNEIFTRAMITKVFETEIKFYTKVVPKCRELEERYNFPAEIRLELAKYYYGSAELEKETVVLEDLFVKDYQAFDRFKCFDWEYASQCVSVLARLHALSVVVLRENPDFFPVDIQDAKTSSANVNKDYMGQAIAYAIEMTAEKHREKLTRFFKAKMTDEGLAEYLNPKRKITLNYGDFRPSNILHKRDENGNLRVIFVDFQIVQKSHPLIDLVTFLICGSDEEFRGKYKQQYFEHYYKEFSAMLQRLAIDPDEVYSKQDFDADVEMFLSFGLTIGVQLLPVITVDESNAPKLEGKNDGNNLTTPTNHLFKARFNGLVNNYVKWGYLS